MKRSFRLSLTIVAAAMAAVHAQEALPKGETLLEKAIDVTGGREAYTKLNNSVSTGKMEVAAQGITGAMTMYRARPAFSLAVIEIPGVGKIEEGVNGDIAWSNSAMTGPRLKEGDEKKLNVMMAQFDAELRWRDLYKSAETVGVEDVGGKPAYKVIVTPKDGPSQTRFYDKANGLLTKMTMTMKSPMGEMPVETLLSDYREVDGIKTPHKITQSVAGQQVVITIDSIKNNTEIDKARFELPAEIKALLPK